MTKHPIEVITFIERRRRWSREDKERLVAEMQVWFTRTLAGDSKARSEYLQLASCCYFRHGLSPQTALLVVAQV